jgi:dTDP-4-dehydrorhamnose reductase
MKPGMLITGGAGLLASSWAMQMRDRYRVTLGLHTRQVSLPGVLAETLDLESISALTRAFDRLDVDMVVHTAAMTSVEDCEAHPAKARYVNAALAGNVAEACVRQGAKLAHISTDHLFAGRNPLLTESEPIEPMNVYASSKAEGEQRTLEACPKAIVARTNFYGWGLPYLKSFSDRIIESLRNGHEIGLFTDVYFTPLLMGDLIAAAHDLSNAGDCGIFNFVGDERLSKHSFGVKLARAFGLNEALIRPSLFYARSDLVKRPSDLSLSNVKLCSALGRKLGDVDSQLAKLLAQERHIFVPAGQYT